MLRIGYLIPEFPGQTHIFLWRESRALAELGIETDFVSTRRPPRAIISHAWGAEVASRTRYLVPLGAAVGGAVLELLRRPRGAIRGLAAAMGSETSGGVAGRLRMLALLLMAARLSNLARERGWTHVHVHSCADSANIAMLAQRLGGSGYSLTLHGPTLEGYGPNQRRKWRHARFAVIISRLLTGVVYREVGSDRPALLYLAPMGVDVDAVRRQGTWTPPTPGGEVRVFACGRLNPVKGHADLIEAVASLRHRGLDIRLAIAGEDEQGGTGYRRDLEALIAERGLGDVVTLLGAVSEAEVRSRLEAAHVFALASHDEGIAVSIMEAMAMAMPVVVTDVGGNSELITSGQDALLVPPRRPAALAEALAGLVANPERAAALARASRARVVRDFHHRRSAEAVADGVRRTVPGAAAALSLAPQSSG